MPSYLSILMYLYLLTLLPAQKKLYVLLLLLLYSQVQRHLANVYAALAGTVLACALGAALDLWLHIGGLLTLVGGGSTNGLGQVAFWLFFMYIHTQRQHDKNLHICVPLVEGRLSVFLRVHTGHDADVRKPRPYHQLAHKYRKTLPARSSKAHYSNSSSIERNPRWRKLL